MGIKVEFERKEALTVISNDGGSIMSTKTLKVLLVEDNPAILSVLTKFLQDKGFEVVGMQSIETAVAALTKLTAVEDRYDCIVLDWFIPPSDISLWVTVVRRYAPFSGIVVISGTDDLMVPAMRAGADDFVRKTAMVKELAPAVIETAEFRARTIKRGDDTPKEAL